MAHECSERGPCAIHKAGWDRVRGAYTRIIMAAYDHSVLEQMIVRTGRMMLEDMCPATKPSECTCQLLDDQTTAVLDQAAIAGKRYAASAAAYVRLTYGDKAEH